MWGFMFTLFKQNGRNDGKLRKFQSGIKFFVVLHNETVMRLPEPRSDDKIVTKNKINIKKMVYVLTLKHKNRLFKIIVSETMTR